MYRLIWAISKKGEAAIPAFTYTPPEVPKYLFSLHRERALPLVILPRKPSFRSINREKPNKAACIGRTDNRLLTISRYSHTKGIPAGRYIIAEQRFTSREKILVQNSNITTWGHEAVR